MDISIHFNAAAPTAAARAVEVYYATAKDVAARVSAAITSVSGLRDRGAKFHVTERFPNGMAFTRNTDKPALLIEICFVDSETDALLYQKSFDAICRVIAEVITGAKITASAATVMPLCGVTSIQPEAGIVTDKGYWVGVLATKRPAL